MSGNGLTGSHLGRYAIEARLGAGGMGEVYRARDERLGREVAVKVLPEAVAGDPDRLRRFEQEAQAAGTLNHSNILTVFDVGTDGGVSYLVTELLTGESLRDVVRRGPVPLSAAVAMAAQVAHGLAAAHERGIVHRDIKPENLFVTRDGAVKILDFGLARLLPEADEQGDDVSTMSRLTEDGMVLGTTGYMAPEQIRGEPVDARADLFALGVVLHEMLTGANPFARPSRIETLSAILKEAPPDPSASGPDVPPALTAVIGRLLAKDRERRFRSAADLAFALESATAAPAVAQPTPAAGSAAATERRPPRRSRLLAPIGLVVGLAAGTGLGLLVLAPRHTPPPREVVRFSIHLPADQTAPAGLALSRDGRTLAYVVGEGLEPGRSAPSSFRLWVRRLGERRARPLPGSEWADAPFFSPDGSWLAYYSGSTGGVERVPLAGGSPAKLHDVSGFFGGGDWEPDGAIVLGLGAVGLRRLTASGTEQEALTSKQRGFGPGEVYHCWPQVLPGGREVLFTALSESQRRLGVLSLATGERKDVLEGAWFGAYADGFLVYTGNGGDLYTVPFDPHALTTLGNPQPTGETVNMAGVFPGSFTLSASGTLAYIPAGETRPDQLVLVGPRGDQTALRLDTTSRSLRFARLSPDGDRVVLREDDDTVGRIAVYARGGRGRRIIAEGNAWWSIWTPDGRSIIHNQLAADTNAANLYRRAADGSGRSERLTSSPNHQQPLDVTPDGRLLLYQEISPDRGIDLWLLPLEGDRTPRALLRTPADENQGAFSPDGRWLAYASDETGRSEVYVRSFPAGDTVLRVSEDGGGDPAWGRDGRDIFFRSSSGLVIMRARFAASPRPSVESPVMLTEGHFHGVSQYGPQLDAAPDGRVMTTLAGVPIRREIRVVVGFTSELRKKLATTL